MDFPPFHPPILGLRVDEKQKGKKKTEKSMASEKRNKKETKKKNSERELRRRRWDDMDVMGPTFYSIK